MNMEKLLSIVADVVENIATAGAGFRSIGIFYEPEVPEELL